MPWAVIPAAGVGRRMRGSVPKQYLPLAGKTVLEHALAPFLAEAAIDGVILALPPGDNVWPRIAPPSRKPLRTVAGGAERADSVLAALEALAREVGDDEWVLVHDAARPCLRAADLRRLMQVLADDPVGGILAVPAHDTLKRVAAGRDIHETIDRAPVWLAQTPQMFRLGLLRDALRHALQHGLKVTDEASALELAGHRPRVVEGRTDNLKVTRPSDLALAAFLLAQAKADEGQACA